jgi:hypothetical protein
LPRPTLTASAPDPKVTDAHFRQEVVNGAVSWDVATQYERPAQMWSMRRSRTEPTPAQ